MRNSPKSPRVICQMASTGLLATSLLMSGCFSALNDWGEGLSDGPGSGSSGRTKAAVLDVVTFPIQAPLLAVLVVTSPIGMIKRHNEEAEQKHIADLRAQLKANPAQGLDEKWLTSSDQDKVQAMRESLSEDIAFYPEPIKNRVFDEIPDYRTAIFKDKSCFADFIAAHYEAVLTQDNPTKPEVFVAMLMNPNTPLSVLDKAFNDTPKHRVYIFLSPACNSTEFIEKHFTEVSQQSDDGGNTLRALLQNPFVSDSDLQVVAQDSETYGQNSALARNILNRRQTASKRTTQLQRGQ
ncbi:MAG TPA: hypothetical protein VK737_09205 [Opitutales bacterium]|jgi:hypothetical protein|nr:hypothetical protein [Opitutales bacterium]